MVLRKTLLVIALLVAGMIGITQGAKAQGLFPGLPVGPTITGVERIPGDTQLGSGLPPQTAYYTTNNLAQYNGLVTALTDGATVTIDASLSNVYTLSMGAVGVRTISTPSNITAGKTFDLILTHSTAGSTASWPGIYKFTCTGAIPCTGGAPTLSTTVNSIDVMRVICTSSSVCLVVPHMNAS